MKLGLYSVRDSRAGTYSQVMTHTTPVDAWRAFAGAVQDSQLMISRWPEDFELVMVGTFDPSEGVLEACKEPQLMVSGAEIVRRLAARASKGPAEVPNA